MNTSIYQIHDNNTGLLLRSHSNNTHFYTHKRDEWYNTTIDRALKDFREYTKRAESDDDDDDDDDSPVNDNSLIIITFVAISIASFTVVGVAIWKLKQGSIKDPNLMEKRSKPEKKPKKKLKHNPKRS